MTSIETGTARLSPRAPEPFKRVAATIRKHAEGILAYVRSGLSYGRTEGLNGKARTITRRAYGFHSASGLIALRPRCVREQIGHHQPSVAQPSIVQ